MQMKIGILSDTHGHVTKTLQAIRMLRAEKVGLVIHAGDIGSEGVLHELMEQFGAEGIAVHAVLGNVDLYSDTIRTADGVMGVTVRRFIPDLKVDGVHLAVVHGDDARILAEFLDNPDLDYVVTGHTHVAEDRANRRPRLLNPGAVYRATVPSCAVLDTATAEFRVLPLV
jgi:putative phosphoesterase